MPNILHPIKQAFVAQLLRRGVGIREIERETGIHRDTVMRLRRRLFAGNGYRIPQPKSKRIRKNRNGLRAELKPEVIENHCMRCKGVMPGINEGERLICDSCFTKSISNLSDEDIAKVIARLGYK